MDAELWLYLRADVIDVRHVSGVDCFYTTFNQQSVVLDNTFFSCASYTVTRELYLSFKQKKKIILLIYRHSNAFGVIFFLYKSAPKWQSTFLSQSQKTFLLYIVCIHLLNFLCAFNILIISCLCIKCTDRTVHSGSRCRWNSSQVTSKS